MTQQSSKPYTGVRMKGTMCPLNSSIYINIFAGVHVYVSVSHNFSNPSHHLYIYICWCLLVGLSV